MFERLHRHRYPASLALVSAGVLGLGVLLKPVPKQVPKAVIPESEIARLQALTRRKNLQDTFKYFSGLAQEAAVHLVRIEQAGSSGLVWDTGGRIVAPAPPEGSFAPYTLLTAAGGRLKAEAGASSPNAPLAELQAPAAARLEPAETTAADRLEPGSWIVQVSRQANAKHLFTPGIFSGTVPAVCGDFRYEEVQTSLPLGPAMLGGGLFDMDGGLVAIVTRCGGRYTAVAAQDINRALKRADGLAGRLLQRYGLQVAPLDDAARAHFKSDRGVLVSEVWRGRPADTAGLVPGDVITELDGAPVNAGDDLAGLTQSAPPEAFSLRCRRGGRSVTISLQPAAANAHSQGASGKFGLIFQSPERGFVAEAVEPGSRAYRAGVRAGDRLLQINGRRPAGVAAARRILSSQNAAPSYLVFERGMKVFGVLL